MHPRALLALIALPVFPAALTAQGRGARVDSSFNVSSNPVLSSFRFRSIGPASMGGRVDDIEVSLSDPDVVYVGYAVGGVFKSENNAVSFKPVFQTYSSASIGDIAIHPTNPGIVYVGTGEPNNRQTSSFGDGIYKTTDGGKTFTNIGLRETQTIARIVIDPRNPEVVYVASPGHLFGPNPDRGIYKTTDGGRTWNKIKYVDENTGFTDIVMDPSNSSVLYAASYQRRRTSCCFNGGGPGSAVWKTEDAGRTWTKLTNGLPPGTYGRIALGVSASSPNVVYAQVEAGESNTPLGAGPQNPIATETVAGGGGGAGGGRGGFDWCNNGGPTGGFPAAAASGAGAGARAGRGGRGAVPAETTVTTPPAPPVLEAARGGVFRSDNRGRSFTLITNCNARPMYFSQLRVDPTNPNTIYVAGLPVAKSLDAGKTFATLDDAGGNSSPGHVDQHAIWIDPKNPKHLMIGNDGGLDISYDQGRTWDFVNTMATGLAYVVTADNERPYNVYTGLQDNNSWGGPSSKRGRGGVTNMDWFGICGGDGFYTGVNVDHPNLVYCESQNGNTQRYDLNTGQTMSIRPSSGATPGRGAAGNAPCIDGGSPAAARGGGGGGIGGGRGAARKNVINSDGTESYRFNWNTPYELSPHNPSIIYLGGNRLFKSYDGGASWVQSADLTRQIDRCRVAVMGVGGDRTQLSKNDGLSQYSTIIAVSESPVMPGVVWAGTDDALVQLSRDGGITFTEVGKNIPGLPQGALTNDDPFWISRIDASHFDPGTAYIAIDGHRSDDLHPHVYVTRDYGRTFQSVAGDLPSYGNIQVVREDPKNRDLLFVGTEFGLYVSQNGGKHWEKFMNDYPTVRTDDILIHPRESDLIVATHGRSIWIADDISPLQQFTPAVASQDVYFFQPRAAVAYVTDLTNNPHIGGQKNFVGANAPRGTAISYYLKSGANDVKVSIVDGQGRTLCTSEGGKSAGIHKVQWTLSAPMLGGAGGTGGGGGGGGGFGAPNGPPDMGCSGGGGGRGAGGGGFGGGAVNAITPGTYTAKLVVNGQTYTHAVEVLDDRGFRAR